MAVRLKRRPVTFTPPERREPAWVRRARARAAEAISDEDRQVVFEYRLPESRPKDDR